MPGVVGRGFSRDTKRLAISRALAPEGLIFGFCFFRNLLSAKSMATPPSTLADSSMSFSRIARRIFLAALVLFLLAYLGDSLWFQLRVRYPSVGPSTGSVHRIRLLAIQLKNNKVEYQIDAQKPEEDLTCARSLFPHSGVRPCWYVTRHAKDPISM
jgi:hypothetical protein